MSASFLRAAAEGEATIHWHHLARGTPGALHRLQSMGHTSGRDAWSGFIQLGRRLAAPSSLP
ncbi:MAG: hypothetical protein ACK2UK_15705 [Candidatus Promineifilaceae bacterium]